LLDVADRALVLAATNALVEDVARVVDIVANHNECNISKDTMVGILKYVAMECAGPEIAKVVDFSFGGNDASEPDLQVAQSVFNNSLHQLNRSADDVIDDHFEAMPAEISDSDCESLIECECSICQAVLRWQKSGTITPNEQASSFSRSVINALMSL
jgi:hypothetical protein